MPNKEVVESFSVAVLSLAGPQPGKVPPKLVEVVVVSFAMTSRAPATPSIEVAWAWKFAILGEI